MQTVNGIELDAFTYAYLTCALWSTNDNSDDNGGEPFDQNYTPDDVHPDTLRKMVEDCNAFRAMEWTYRGANVSPHWDRVTRTVTEWLGEIPDDKRRGREEWSADDLDGHDFWLTREGHGAGFWDRGYGRMGSILTDAASSFGGFDLYLGDDGMIHGS